VAFNGNHEARSINIPDDNWTIVCDDGRINEQGLGYVKGAVATVAPQSALIIYR